MPPPPPPPPPLPASAAKGSLNSPPAADSKAVSPKKTKAPPPPPCFSPPSPGEESLLRQTEEQASPSSDTPASQDEPMGRKSSLPPPPPPPPPSESEEDLLKFNRVSLLPPPPSPPPDYSPMAGSFDLPPPPPDPGLKRLSSFDPKAPAEKTRSGGSRSSVRDSIQEVSKELAITPKEKRPAKEFNLSDYIASPPISKGESLKAVEKLKDVPLTDKDCCSIDGGSVNIHYEASMDTAFRDTDAFATGQAVFIEEAQRQAKLDELLEEGYGYASMLYCWRSCSFAIPQLKSQSVDKQAYYCSVCDVLEPQIDKLRALMAFQSKAVRQLTEEVRRLTLGSNTFISEACLLSLGKMINMLSVLDELKNIKASMKNDFSLYKRSAEISKRHTLPEDLTNSRDLSVFLASNNVFITAVKDKLFPSKGKLHEVKNQTEIETLLCNIVNTCQEMYDKHQYLYPHEKHGMVKVIGFCLFLLDGEVNINKMDGNRKLHLSKIDKIFKELEAVPLYGDMMIGPFQYIQKTPNYNPSKWPSCNSSKDSSQSNLLVHMNHLRAEHMALVGELALYGKHREAYEEIIKTPLKSDTTEEVKQQLYYDLALRLLRTLSSWTSRLTELFSWKMLHPTDHSLNRNCPDDAEDYEKASKYNYSTEEKNALAEVIGMIKRVQETALAMELQFRHYINGHIYLELQNLVQIDLREPLRKLRKDKKDILVSIVEGIRDICSDIVGSPEADPLNKGKKDADTGYKVPIGKRHVGPSSTQLYMLRTMLEGLIHRAKKKKDIKQEAVTQIEKFLEKSYFWNHLINFNRSVRFCCDLSQFWFREFYLELTKGARKQFPIDMSFPWILANHILDTHDPRMMEYLLFPMDLYNDSANWAFTHFKQRYMYEELEAEVNLVFDQLTYKLSEQVFAYYKHLAGSIYLDRTFREICKKKGIKIPYPPQNRYATLLKQRSIKILGREVDVNKLVSQRMNANFSRALGDVIKRFESSDLTSVVEFEGLIEINRLAHRLLSDKFEMASFDSLLQEANHKINSDYGRFTLHIFYEINLDFLPHYCYNAATNRYVMTAYALTDKAERGRGARTARAQLWGHELLARCYAQIYSRYSGFVGEPHFRAMVKFMDYQDFALVITELMKVIKSILSQTIKPYTTELTKKGVFPERCILPKYDYTSPGVLFYYKAQLDPIIRYPDLQMVYQGFRELGNAILFCLHLESALGQKEISELKHAAIFQSIIPKPFVKLQGKDAEAKEAREAELSKQMERLKAKYKHCHLVPCVGRKGKPEQMQLAKDSSVLSREKLCIGLSVFEMVLTKLKLFLDQDKEVWDRYEAPPANSVLEVEESRNFHRLWSALQFIFCIPVGENQLSVEQLFGDSLSWGGLALVTLLGQYRRFQMTDFSYHLVKVHAVDNLTGDKKADLASNVKVMAARIRQIQHLNDQIFTVLNKYLYQPKDKYSHLYNAKIKHFEPPRAKTGDIPESGAQLSMRRGKSVKGAIRDSIDLIDDDFDDEQAPRDPHSDV